MCVASLGDFLAPRFPSFPGEKQTFVEAFRRDTLGSQEKREAVTLRNWVEEHIRAVQKEPSLLLLKSLLRPFPQFSREISLVWVIVPFWI